MVRDELREAVAELARPDYDVPDVAGVVMRCVPIDRTVLPTASSAG